MAQTPPKFTVIHYFLLCINRNILVVFASGGRRQREGGRGRGDGGADGGVAADTIEPDFINYGKTRQSLVLLFKNIYNRML